MLIKAMTWDYPTEGEHEEPDIESILKEVSGYNVGRRASRWAGSPS